MSTTRRIAARGLAATTMAAALVAGASVAPASAATSGRYFSYSDCHAAQVATGASSFVAITRSCYRTGEVYQPVPGVYDPTVTIWRFQYRTR